MSVRERKFLVGGNWKMNGTKSSIDNILMNMKEGSVSPETDVVVAPPSCYLMYVQDNAPVNVQVAAQNCYKAASGAFTGEISANMLRDIGIQWTIIGHSERRNIFGESNELIGDKVQFAVKSGLNVIACVGENLAERKCDRIKEVVCAQLKAISDKVVDWSQVVIAYEPVWAIGTGLTATPEQAQEVHCCLRKSLGEISDTVASQTRIIYGGSVNGSNCKDLAAMSDIDGFLVGGASLKPEFIDIINAKC